MSLFNAGAGIPKPPAASGKLEQNPKNVVSPAEGIRLSNLQLHTDGLTAGTQHCQGLRQHGSIHQETACTFAFAHTKAHRHRLSSSRGFIEQGRIGDRQSRQLADQGLKIQQCLQAPLSDLCLIRGVGGVPGGIFQHLTLNQSRGDGIEITQTDQGTGQLVATGNRSQFSQGRSLIDS